MDDNLKLRLTFSRVECAIQLHGEEAGQRVEKDITDIAQGGPIPTLAGFLLALLLWFLQINSPASFTVGTEGGDGLVCVNDCSIM